MRAKPAAWIAFIALLVLAAWSSREWMESEDRDPGGSASFRASTPEVSRAGSQAPAPDGTPDLADNAGTPTRLAMEDRRTPVDPTEILVQGWVLDYDDKPLAGVELRVGAYGIYEVAGRTDEQGAFSFVHVQRFEPCKLRASPPWFLCCPADRQVGSWTAPRTLRGFQTRPISVTVRDPRGDPIHEAKARVTIGSPEFPGERFFTGWAESDDAGLLEVDVPDVPGRQVELSAIGFDPRILEAEETETTLEWGQGAIYGTVQAVGDDRAHVTLRLGERITRVSLSLRPDFRLPVGDQDVHGEALIVTADGFGPLLLSGVGDEYMRRGGRHPSLHLRLEAARTWTGRVVDAEGRLRKGIEVGLLDPTPVGSSFHESGVVRTADDGSFSFEGLGSRSYTLRAVHPGSLRYVDQEIGNGARGGSTVRLPAGTTRAVSVYVLRHNGTPLERRSVSVGVNVPLRPGRGPNRWAHKAQTGPDGLAAFDALPDQELDVQVQGADHEPARLLPGVTTLTLRVHSNVPVRFVRRGPGEPPQAVSFLAADGRRVGFTGGSLDWSRSGRGADLRRESSTVHVRDSAVEAVFYRNGEEVLRVPIDLTPDGRIEIDI